MELYPHIDCSNIKTYEIKSINKLLLNKGLYPKSVEINVSKNNLSKSSISFNILPHKIVTEDIYIKKYILKKRYIESVFDREYLSNMVQSPDHLIFLSSLVNLQKMIYIYLCYEFGLIIDLANDEKLKIWPTNITIDMPKMITKTKGISQVIKIKKLRKTGIKTYFGKCESSIDNIVNISADALIYTI